ncbi:hypothetical protein ACRRTK_014845 [Alexandromys fortis]
MSVFRNCFTDAFKALKCTACNENGLQRFLYRALFFEERIITCFPPFKQFDLSPSIRDQNNSDSTELEVETTTDPFLASVVIRLKGKSSFKESHNKEKKEKMMAKRIIRYVLNIHKQLNLLSD